MKRNTPIAAMSARRAARLAGQGIRPTSTLAPKMSTGKRPSRKPALPERQKSLLTARSGGYCEIRLARCSGIAIDPSHRSGTRLGGRHGDAAVQHARLSNVLHSCRQCHQWLHDHPQASKSEGVGWALEEWQEPTEWPVLYRGVLSWLTDDGQVIPCTGAAA